MVKDKSKELCVVDRDFTTAYAHYKKATARWKEHWYEACAEIYNGEKCPSTVKKSYELNIEEHTVIKVKKTKANTPQIYYNGCEKVEIENGAEILYVIVMRDENKNAIYYKVGTTTRKVEQRMAEHLDYYRLEGIKYIEINRVADCGTIPAEGLESYLRAKLIRENPTAFKKNDRFIAEETVKFELEEIDKWIAEYLDK